MRIANWLFYNGVAIYERRYEFDTATDTHASIARTSTIRTPGSVTSTLRWMPMASRRSTFPTTTKGCTGSGRSMRHAAPQWSKRRRSACAVDRPCRIWPSGWASGVELDPNPDRELPDQGAADADADLIGLMRTFIAHAKSNCLTLDDMAPRQMQSLRISSGTTGAPGDRRRFSRPGTHWLTSAALISNMSTWPWLLEQGHYESPYELVMADEFQTLARPCAFCRALVSQPAPSVCGGR